MLRILYLVILIQTILILSNCQLSSRRLTFDEIDRIPIKNKAERIKKFSSYQIEKQIDVYLFAVLEVEGSYGEFREYLTTDGNQKINAIANRIKISKDMIVKVKLLEAIRDISKECHCVANNPDVMNIISDESNWKDDENDSSSDRELKKLYVVYLDDIRSD